METDEALKILGRKLRWARRVKDCKQEDAGREVNVTQKTVSNWEKGHTSPGFLEVVGLAALYGVALGWLADPRESLPEGGVL